MTTLYIVAAAAGLGYAVLSFLLGTLGGDGDGGDAGGHGADAGGHDADAGGHDADAEAEADVEADGADHGGLPLLSPTVIASLAAGFGFGGVGLAGLGLPALVHVPGALAVGVGLAWLMALFLARGVRGMDATTSASPTDFEGAEAEVTTPIPGGGMGEIAIVHGGTRFTEPARCAVGCGRGARVLVVRARPDGTYDVSPLPRIAAGGHAGQEE